MARRSQLPGADELFRTTSTGSIAMPSQAGPSQAGPSHGGPAQQVPYTELPVRDESDTDESPRSGEGGGAVAAHPSSRPRAGAKGVRRVSRTRQTPGSTNHPSGRERHEEKITVYVSPEELVSLERARWVLRAEHGLASDRGRLVREAIAVVLADFEAKGANSILVTRLQD